MNHTKSHCRKGHEFTPENTRTYGGVRRCKSCQADYNRLNVTRDPLKTDSSAGFTELRLRAQAVVLEAWLRGMRQEL